MQQKKILVVDDEQDIRDLLKLVLTDRGHIVSTAEGGPEALWMVVQEKPDLVVLDLSMPQMSGDQVCRLIKSDPSLQDIIIFILTARNDLKTKLACLEMGAEEFLVKPIDINELAARIERFFNMLDYWTNRAVAHRPQRQHSVQQGSGVTPLDSGEIPTVKQRQKYGVHRIESLAGKGGMGIVYKAYDEVLQRYVAVKVLSKEWSESQSFVERFQREARLIAAINHPGIAQIYTFGEEEGESYFTLEWCPGGSLAHLIRKEGRLGVLTALDIILQCARALMAASTKGVVHRDVKPSNILFSHSQQVKIVDFGVAHSQTMSATSESEIVGSPAYMAPEQAHPGAIDHRADVYSLGITFYQLLYGKLPFSAKSHMEWTVKHMGESFPAFDDLGGQVPESAYRLIQKMTQKDPSNRYQDYLVLIGDLENLRNELFRRCQLKIPTVQTIPPTPTFVSDSVFDLLARIYCEKKSGVVRMSWGALQKKFLILRNDIIFFESPQEDEDLWKALVKKDLLKSDDIPEVGDLEQNLNDLLFRQTFSPEDFQSVYRDLMKSSLTQVFLWSVFHGEFFEAEIEQDPFCKIPLARFLLEAAHTWVSYETVKNQIPEDFTILRTERFEAVLERLNLQRAESYLASRIEGVDTTLETLHFLTGFAPDRIARFIFALKGLNAVECKPRGATKTPRPKDKAYT